MLTLALILSDPVFKERCRGLGVSDGRTLVCQDPYHRYYRILRSCEKLGLPLSGATALDLGCLRPELASLLGLAYGCSVTGIDQWDMLASWEDKLIRPMRFYNHDLAGDWASLFRCEAGFDVVFALEIIEHMVDTDAFLRRVGSVLKEGGWLVISTPNLNSLRNRCMVPLGKYPAHMEYRNTIHHVRLYNPSVLTSQIREHGFEPVCVFGINFLSYRGPMHWRMYRVLSEWLASRLPNLSSSFCCIARKRDS